MQTGITVLVSVNADGTASASGPSTEPSVSEDGRFVAFESTATNLITSPPDSFSPRDIFVRDLVAGTTVRARASLLGAYSTVQSGNGLLSPTGHQLLFRTSQTAMGSGWVLRDFLHGTNVLLSQSFGFLSDPISFLARFSTDGEWLVFSDRAVGSRNTALFVCDTRSMKTQMVVTNGLHPSISADGCLIAFESGPQTAPSTPAARQVWVLNRQATSNSFQLVSVNAQGTGPANGNSSWPTISSNGRYVTFQSEATDLVPNDTNGFADIFVRDLLTDQLTRLSTSRFGSMAANSLSLGASASADGETVAFTSFASDLVDGDLNESSDVFAAHLVHTDSDGDGRPDDWELAYFGGLSYDGTADSDGDGLTDLQEFTTGTNPMDATSTLRILNVSYLNSGEVLMDWSSVPGKNYQIQFTQDLNDPAWTDVARPFVGTSFRATQQFPIALAQQRGCFRIRLIDPATM